MNPDSSANASGRSHATGSLSDVVLHLSPLQKVVAVLLVAVAVFAGTKIIYQTNSSSLIEIPRTGGTHREAIVGTPRFINPLLAISDADRDLAAVVYASLLTRNSDNALVPELAEGYTLTDNDTVYTFTLRDNLFFHDGTPLTAHDVVFTVQQAANENIRSPLFANWEGVIVDATNDRTVVFTLPEPYAPFIENTTIGILPKHLWMDLAEDEFAFSQLNTEPIGAGPYQVKNVVVDRTGIPERYELEAFIEYARGTPHITYLEFQLYRDKNEALTAFMEERADGVHSVEPALIDTLLTNENTRTFSVLRAPQLRVFGVFFNHNRQPLFIRKDVRSALDEATPKEAVVAENLKGYGSVLHSPIPNDVAEWDKRDRETATTDIATGTRAINHIERAREILESGGWERGEDGVYIRETDDESLRLSFTLTTVDTKELQQAAERVVESWNELGAEVEIKIFNTADLTQSVIRPRRHESLLFGMEVGHELDLYAFWHSSQRNDPGLNIAQFADIEADAALEKLRATSDINERTELLSEFADRVEEAKAGIFLYAPDLTYLVREDLQHNALHPVSDPSERFDTIHEWYIETDRVWPVVKDLLD